MADNDKVDELLEDARFLAQKDFKDRLYDRQIESSNDETERTYTYLIMKRCKETSNLTRVFGIESSQIEDWVAKLNIEL